MLFNCSACYRLCRAGQDTAERLITTDSQSQNPVLNSIFSAVGPQLTVRARTNQNVSCVVDLFVGDRRRGQPFNQASVIDGRRNYHAIPYLRTRAQKWHRAGSTHC